MTFSKMIILAGAVALAGGMAPSAQAASVVLTFEGVGDNVAVGDFYDGGAGGDLGIGFVNAFGLVDGDNGGGGNFANEPSASTVLYFTSGSASTMNVAAGFTTGFSFFYSSANAASVSVYSGLNGTGALLASLSLMSQNNLDCAGDPTGAYCNWTPIGVTFAGIAQSVAFGGSANFVAFDNITLGAATPGGGVVPEPATWAMMLLGFGAIGYRIRRSPQLTRRVRSV